MKRGCSPPSQDELQCLPIFPLPEVVLFPDTLLPLHIFEPRYQDMMAWALKHNSPIVVAQLIKGYESTYFDSPAIQPIAGVGRLNHHARRPDGSYDLILSGVGRVKLEEEFDNTDHTFRTGRFSLIEDTPAEEATLRAQRSTLEGLGTTFCSCRPRLARVLVELNAAPLQGPQLSNLLCSLLLPCADERQAALECVDPVARLDTVIDALISLLPQCGGDEVC